ncbi:MAG: ABC transporter ATP-binding protein [Actinomycetota bacterium]|nr:ABC transporter ATP-binding protein [Actinomycetota bacterium]
MADAPLLAVDALRVEYDGVPAVHEVSLEIRAGEIVALVGANGAGKSSTLRAIAGAARPAAGEIRLDGERVDGLEAHEIVARGIAHVPEGRRLFGPMTVEENLRLGASQVKDRAEIARRLERVGQMFPVIASRAGQRADTLSGGEQQLVAVARGLMSEPRLILLDEPSLGVMPLVVGQLYELVRTLADEGVAVIVADQNLERLLRLADRAYVFRTGVVVLEGTGAELLDSPEVREAFLGI